MTAISLNGTPMHTYGDLPLVGNKAPDFTMTRADLSEVRLSDCIDKKVILNIFPSLDTPVCAAAMIKFNELAALKDNLIILCVSIDLPFAQKRFCNTEHLDNIIPVSIFRNTEFGKTYGMQIIDGPLAGLLSRAVVLIDQNGTITYTQQLKKIEDEPDYQALMSKVATS